MKFVSFAAPDGGTVRINPDQVISIHDAEPGAYAPGTQSVITLTAGFQAVKEDAADVEKKLRSL